MKPLKYSIDETYMPGGANVTNRQKGPLAQQERSKTFGTISYQCKHKQHTTCAKMSCPCECHKDENKQI